MDTDMRFKAAAIITILTCEAEGTGPLECFRRLGEEAKRIKYCDAGVGEWEE